MTANAEICSQRRNLRKNPTMVQHLRNEERARRNLVPGRRRELPAGFLESWQLRRPGTRTGARTYPPYEPPRNQREMRLPNESRGGRRAFWGGASRYGGSSAACAAESFSVTRPG
jgi:hypothetical protein